jgi:hypothetical protein
VQLLIAILKITGRESRKTNPEWFKLALPIALASGLLKLDYPEPTLVTLKRKQILLVQQTGVR